MRRRLIVAFWALTGLVVSSDRVWGRQTPGESADRLSLAQAVELALERNPLIRSVQAGVSQAEAGLAEAEAGRLPNLSFEQGFTNSNNPVYVFGTLLEQERFGAEHFDPAESEGVPIGGGPCGDRARHQGDDQADRVAGHVAGIR